MSDAVDHLLDEADRFVGQGGGLVSDLAAAIRVLRERIVTVDIDGRTVRYDKVAECEASLDLAEKRCAQLEAVLGSAGDLLVALPPGHLAPERDSVLAHIDALLGTQGVAYDG
jgi:hypothetical protein